MKGSFIPIVIAPGTGIAVTYISGSFATSSTRPTSWRRWCRVGNCRASTRTADPRYSSGTAGSRNNLVTAFRTVSKPLELAQRDQRATVGRCSQAREPIPVRTTRDGQETETHGA